MNPTLSEANEAHKLVACFRINIFIYIRVTAFTVTALNPALKY